MENPTSNISIELVHQIPTGLHEYRDALQGALYYLSLGERPAEIPKGDAKSVRFSLPPKGIIVLEKLIPVFGSRTKVITAALAWVSEQSDLHKYMYKHMRPYDY